MCITSDLFTISFYRLFSLFSNFLLPLDSILFAQQQIERFLQFKRRDKKKMKSHSIALKERNKLLSQFPHVLLSVKIKKEKEKKKSQKVLHLATGTETRASTTPKHNSLDTELSQRSPFILLAFRRHKFRLLDVLFLTRFVRQRKKPTVTIPTTYMYPILLLFILSQSDYLF